MKSLMNPIKKNLVSLALALVACAASAAQDVLVRYPDYPAAIERDAAYAVRVRQGDEKRRLVVWNHCEKSMLERRTRGGDVNRRFCEFAFAGSPVTVDIAVREDVRCYKVFPARKGLKHVFRNGVISVTLTEPTYFGVQLNDYDKTILSVFADAPEIAADIPAPGAPGVLRVEGWRDAPGADGVLEVPQDVKEVYLAPGAVLNARLKIRHPNVRLHGRGMVLDPMSDIFRYDQVQNPMRGLVLVQANDVTVEGVKLVDARTFNFVSWGRNIAFRDVKILSTMMCSDGFTNGGRNLLVDNAWVYVGDNGLVVNGIRDATYRNVAIGTSCKAIFPQCSNSRIRMEGVDVFRADEGVIANEYNGALRRDNKWSEMGTGLQKREPGPQDLEPQTEDFFFDGLSAIDATYVGYVFRGRNMGDLPKTFGFRNLSVPHVPGRDGWRGIGVTNGVSVAVQNDAAKWLNTSNYRLAVTNLYLAGRRAAAFPPFAVEPKDAAVLDLSVVTDGALPRTVALAPDRVEVNWTCPDTRKRRLPTPPVNLLEDHAATRSIWQRHPSWSVKMDACSRDEAGAVVYRLRQCERNAGMQAVLTARVKAAGFGTYRLAFEAKARSETPFALQVLAVTNEKQNRVSLDAVRDGAWHAYETDVDLSFDPAQTDLVALLVAVSAPADELCFRNFRLVRAGRPVPSAALRKRLDAGLERYGIVHFSLNTFTDREWGYGNENPELFNPTAFDADQIVRAGKEGGLQGLIVVAKHHDGFCLWPTKTTEHNIAKSPFRNGKGDYVKEMQLACERHGLAFGVYVSPWDRNSAAYATPAYRETFRQQVLELFSGGYGRPFELWFDGANGGDGWYGGACERRTIPPNYYRFQDLIDEVRALDPDVCVFGDGDAGDLRWPGNESGDLHPDARATTAARGQGPTPGWEDARFKGDVNGALFKQPECDFPLRPGWFWHAAHDGFVRSPAFLMKVYLRTCGNGGTMNVGLAPDRRGLLPEADVAALRGFEAMRQRFFATRVEPKDGFNVVVLREDVSDGERVDGWELAVDGRTVATGASVGVKRIRVLDRIEKGARADVRVTRACGTPGRITCEFYAVDPGLVAEVQAARAPAPPKPSFENVGIPTARTPTSRVFLFKHPRTFTSVTLTPDRADVDGTPAVVRLAFSDDGETWRADAAERRLDNVAANPIPQRLDLGRAMTARYIRVTAVRTLREGAPLADVALSVSPPPAPPPMTPVQVKLAEGADPQWRVADAATAEDGVETHRISLTRAADAAVPPVVEISLDVPVGAAAHYWQPTRKGQALFEAGEMSKFSYGTPVRAFVDDGDRSRLTMAWSECVRRVDCAQRIVHEKPGEFYFHVTLKVFAEAEAPLKDWRMELRLDFRDRHWSDAVRDAADWVRRSMPVADAAAPEAAYGSVYSTWYAFNRAFDAATLERECAEAARLGMRTLIADDGWQTTHGDWDPVPGKFPDMRAHVDHIHALGLKYVLWYALPFMNERSRHYAAFKGKYLASGPFWEHRLGILDPRFSEVRAFLADQLVDRLVRWNLDGYKIDFIDFFRTFGANVYDPAGGADPAAAEGYRGRDFKSIPAAAEALVADISRRLKAVRPDVLLEFRQPYAGPVTATYGNMLRANDCPGDAHANRVRTTDLRLTGGGAAVHADMLKWTPSDDPSDAARAILSVIFATVQYSMVLDTIPAAQKAEIRKWIAFADAHRAALQKGGFRAHSPAEGYPVLEGWSDAERIVAVYAPNRVVDLADDGRRTVIVNATPSGTVTVRDAGGVRAVAVAPYSAVEVSEKQVQAETRRRTR